VNTSQGFFQGLVAKFNMLNVLLSNRYSQPSIASISIDPNHEAATNFEASNSGAQ